MPQPKKSSHLGVSLVVVAAAAAVAYLAFFRGSGAPPPAETAASNAAVDPGQPSSAPAPAESAEAEKKDASPAPAPAAETPAPAPAVFRAAAPPPVQARFEPQPPPDPASEIDALMAEGKWREARAKIAAAFQGAKSDAERAETARKGMETCRQLLLSETPDERELELYEIKQGDTLEGIARKFKTLNGVKGAVMLVNNYKENSILRAGRKIRVPRGNWSILVDKSLFRLYLCHEGIPFKEYAVAIGAGQKTPAGKYAVGARNPKPAWWPPAELQIKEVPIKYGDPRNPLGEWWIALEHDLHHGIGIHGTNDPASIGTKSSNGCVRMLNEEVCEIAAIAYKGMAVTIAE